MPDSRPKVFVWVYEGIPNVYCTEGVDVLVVDTDPDASFDCVHGTFECSVETVSSEELREQVNILYTEWLEDKNEYGIPEDADLEQTEKLEHSLMTFGTEGWSRP